MRELVPTLDEWLAGGKQVALATVISTWGSAPRPLGSHLIVSSTGEMAGSVSGGCVETEVVQCALSVLRDGQPQLLDFGVTDELALTVGLSCGGQISVWVQALDQGEVYEGLRRGLRERERVVVLTAVSGPDMGARILLTADGAVVGDAAPFREVIDQAEGTGTSLLQSRSGRYFVQTYLPPPRLIIVGAVHTAIPLVALARALEYEVIVVDARAAFATRARFPHADQLLVQWPDEALTELRPDASTAVVVLAHDPKFEDPALDVALRSRAGYIGAIGSRETSARRLERLQRRGFTAADLRRIHGPVGLDIGAVTPAETALSVLAEVVAEHRQRPGGRLRLHTPDSPADFPATAPE